MKAAVYTKYGPPEVVSVIDVPVPVPKDDQLLVKVFASTVNRTDCGFRSAAYFITRFWSGLVKPKVKVLGCEFAGEVVKVGNAVRLFSPGDRVFGYDDANNGGHGEYLVTSGSGMVATIPPGLGYEEAAPIAEGAHYALSGLRAAKVKSGQKVLVYGATGAIGSAAVQLLKYFGAEVTAVCGTKNTELVKSLGVDRVIDYQREDFTKISGDFDFILDAVGKSSFGQCRPLLKKKGIYVSTELGKRSENIFFAIITPLFGGKKVMFPIPMSTRDDILLLRDLVERKLFRPVIDRVYKLDEIVEAYKYVETGTKTGNVVLRVSS